MFYRIMITTVCLAILSECSLTSGNDCKVECYYTNTFNVYKRVYLFIVNCIVKLKSSTTSSTRPTHIG